MILHHQIFLEEVAISIGSYDFPTPLDPLVPALVMCQKMANLKLYKARLCHVNVLTALEELLNLQELVLEDVSMEEIVSDRLCLTLTLVGADRHVIVF